MSLLNDGAWISCDLRLEPMTSLPRRHAQACCTCPHVKIVPQSETRRNVKRKAENGIASSKTETQNKSSVANELVDMATENMYCKIIYLTLFHLYLAILYFCSQKAHLFFSQYFHFNLQNLIFFCNSSLLLQIYVA